jgi:hypothetical protein
MWSATWCRTKLCALVSISPDVVSRDMKDPQWPRSRITLVAWIIWWIGEHDWTACLRLVTVVVVCALVVCGLLVALHLIGYLL